MRVLCKYGRVWGVLPLSDCLYKQLNDRIGSGQVLVAGMADIQVRVGRKTPLALGRTER